MTLSHFCYSKVQTNDRKTEVPTALRKHFKSFHTPWLETSWSQQRPTPKAPDVQAARPDSSPCPTNRYVAKAVVPAWLESLDDFSTAVI